MLVTTYQKRQRLDKEIIDIRFNEESFNMISNGTMLGVFVDQNLTWSDHIRHGVASLKEISRLFLSYRKENVM